MAIESVATKLVASAIGKQEEVAAKDFYHEHVRKALIKDGWTITDDPLSMKWLGTTLQIDFGAERLIYRASLKIHEPKRALYLAIRDEVYDNTFGEPDGEMLLLDEKINLIIFNADKEEIVKWIS